jgi:hypothetical protein
MLDLNNSYRILIVRLEGKRPSCRADEDMKLNFGNVT